MVGPVTSELIGNFVAADAAIPSNLAHARTNDDVILTKQSAFREAWPVDGWIRPFYRQYCKIYFRLEDDRVAH